MMGNNSDAIAWLDEARSWAIFVFALVSGALVALYRLLIGNKLAELSKKTEALDAKIDLVRERVTARIDLQFTEASAVIKAGLVDIKDTVERELRK